MAHLSKEEIEELARRFATLGKRDTEFEETSSVDSSDIVAIVKGDKNKKITISNFFSELPNIFNLSGYVDERISNAMSAGGIIGSALAEYVKSSGGTFSGTINFEGRTDFFEAIYSHYNIVFDSGQIIEMDEGRITGLLSPVSNTEATNKQYVDTEIGALDNSIRNLSTSIGDIQEVIPSAASSSNQLADKAFVNSSIATSTATFRGTSPKLYTESTFLEWANAISSKDANDYVFWWTEDAAGNTVYKRYKYTGSGWLFEYDLNNSSFTAAQWAAINSLMTSALTGKLVELPTAQQLAASFNAKQNTLVSGSNIKTINNQSLLGRGNIIIDGSVFTAYYDETTYQVILDAYNENNTIICKKRENTGIYVLTAYDAEEERFTFYSYAPDENAVNIITISSESGWSEEQTELQDALVSGRSIKTINGESVLGAGDIVIEPGSEPDNEDITIDSNNRLKFADRAVAANQKGYVILRKNKAFAEQVTDANTIYEIRYDFDLGGNPVTIPAGCELRFVGGVIKNGQVTLNGTTLAGEKFIGDGIALSGTLFNKEVSFDWWAYDLTASCTPMMQSAIDLAADNGKKLCISDGEYLLTISNDSGYRYCLYSEKRVSIKGESRDGTILKTVKTDLSDPDFDRDATDSYGYPYSTSYGCLIKINASENNVSISLESVTLDGGNSQHQSSNKNVGHKALWMRRVSPYNITAIHVKDVCITNFEGEGIYNEGYVGLGYDSDYIIKDSIFRNNGGSSGNVGGSAIYRDCVFDNANIEHTFGGSNHYGRLIVDGCTFRNRDGALSCDKQRTVSSWDSIKGCQCFIKNCIFENTITDTTGFNKIIAVSILETEDVRLENNFFHNAGYRYSQGGCALNIGNYVYNLVSSGNVFVSDVSPFQNCSIVASTCRSNIYKDNVCCIFGGYSSPVLDICDRLILDVAQTENSVNYCGLGSRVWTLHVSVDNRNSVNKTISYFNVQNYYTGGPVAMTANAITEVRNVTSNMASIVIQAPFSNLTIDTPIHVLLNGRLNEDFIPAKQKATGRPTKLTANDAGFIFFDANLGKCIVWNGTAWVNMDGTALS